MPGPLTRLMSCPEEEAPKYQSEYTLVRTHVVPSLTINKEHDDVYSAYNKPGAVLQWIQVLPFIHTLGNRCGALVENLPAYGTSHPPLGGERLFSSNLTVLEYACDRVRTYDHRGFAHGGFAPRGFALRSSPLRGFA